MKTIKNFNSFHPQNQLKQFFSQIHLGEIAYLFGAVGWTILICIVNVLSKFSANSQERQITNGIVQSYGILAFLTLILVSDFVIWIFASLSDIKKQEENKGTLTLFILILIKSKKYSNVRQSAFNYFFLNQTITNIHIKNISSSIEQFIFDIKQTIFQKIVPLQVLVMNQISNAFSYSSQRTYIFIKPFKIKQKFKPICYILLIQIISFRIDLLVAILLELLLVIFKINPKLVYLSRVVEQKFKIQQKLVKFDYLRVRNNQLQLKEIDILKTNNSVIMEEK